MMDMLGSWQYQPSMTNGSIEDNHEAGPSTLLGGHHGLYYGAYGQLDDPTSFDFTDSYNPSSANPYDTTDDIVPLPSAPFGFNDTVSYAPQPTFPHTIVPEQSCAPLTINPSALVAPRVSQPAVSPLDILVPLGPSPSIWGNRLYIRPCWHGKRPIMASPFVDNTFVKPGPSLRDTSSSIDRIIPNGKPSAGVFPDEYLQHANRTRVVPAPNAGSNGVTMATIRPLLTREHFSEHKPIPLFKNLRKRLDKANNPLLPLFQPNPSEAREICIALRDLAPDGYLRNMADDDRYMSVFRKWLVLAAKDIRAWEMAIAPLVELLARTDIPVNYLINLALMKRVKAVKDEAEKSKVAGSSQIAAATQKFEVWVRQTLVPRNRKVGTDEEEEDATKKRKAEEQAAIKKRKLDESADVKDGRDIEVKPIIPGSSAKPAAGAGAGADMSFFGANAGPASNASSSYKPRQRMPDIKKRPAVPAAGPSRPTVPPQPTGQSLLDLTLSNLRAAKAKANVQTPALQAANQKLAEEPQIKPSVSKKPNKKGHLVRFVDETPGRELEAVRLFKQAPHELERAPWSTDEDDVHGASAHDLDVKEGAALRHHENMEEEVVWFEPREYAYYVDADNGLPLTAPTPEAAAQETRELGVLGVTYPTGHIPATPEEVGVTTVQATGTTRTFNPPVDPAAAGYPPAPTQDVSSLLSSLNPQIFGQQAAPAPQPGPYDYNYQNPQPANNYAYGNYGHPAYQPPANGNRWQQQQQQSDPYGYNAGGYNDQTSRGGNNHNSHNNNKNHNHGGNGRNHRTVVCKHWLKDSCFKGDNCTFKHG